MVSENPTKKKEIVFTINGERKRREVNPNRNLLSFIREDLDLIGTKYSCGEGICGSCTVLLDGTPVKSCQLNVSSIEEKEITTIEGISGSEKKELHPVQEAFREAGALQCGYCTPGLVLRSIWFLDRNSDPSREEVREAIKPNICRCTGYKKIVDAIILASEKMGKPLKEKGNRESQNTGLAEGNDRLIGESVTRTDSKRKVKGSAIYGYDYATRAKRKFTDMIETEIVRSPHAHAKIKEIDASEAEAVEGVVKVFSHQDVPDRKFSSAGQPHPVPAPSDTRVLNEKVRYVGEPVAIVAAEDEAAAREGADKLELEFEKLTPVLNHENSVEKEVSIHDNGNLVGEVDVEIGDVDEEFEKSDEIIEREYETHVQKHLHLEPHSCVAWFNEDDDLVIETSSQTVFHIRRKIAEIFDMSERDIKVRSWEMGGAFGNKQDLLIEHYAALITLNTRRPCVIRFSREEEFYLTERRHGTKLKIKIGSDKDGNIRAINLNVISDTGAYGNHGITVANQIGAMTLPLYSKKCKNIRFTGKVVYTNKPVSGPVRGYGSPQGAFALESCLDELADQIDMDPVEIRVKNAIEKGMTDPISEVISETGKIIPREVKSCGLTETLKKGKKNFNWSNKRARSERNENEKKLRGVGVASSMMESGVPGSELASAIVKLNEDGSIFVNMGGSDHGEGYESVIAQIAAETLGVNLDQVKLNTADTLTTPHSMGIYGDSGTYVEGNAVKEAAKDLKGKITDRASKMMDLNPQKLDIRKGQVFHKESSEESIPIEEVAMDAVYGESDKTQLMGFGSAESVESPPSFSTHFAEVEVDEETGEIQVINYLSLTDSGKPLNPREVEGQLEGAITQGIGFTLYEEIEFDDEGDMKNPMLKEYKVPTSVDVPEFETKLVETHEPTGPYGAKSAGEIGIVPPAPAIANAIYDATGIRFRNLPILKEKVKEKLNKQ